MVKSVRQINAALAALFSAYPPYRTICQGLQSKIAISCIFFFYHWLDGVFNTIRSYYSIACLLIFFCCIFIPFFVLTVVYLQPHPNHLNTISIRYDDDNTVYNTLRLLNINSNRWRRTKKKQTASSENEWNVTEMDFRVKVLLSRNTNRQHLSLVFIHVNCVYMCLKSSSNDMK